MSVYVMLTTTGDDYSDQFMSSLVRTIFIYVFFFQAEDGIRDVERSRGLGDVYKRQDYRGISL